MAMEHVGIKDTPVDAKPTPPVIPPVDKPKTTAEPTVDKSKKPKEEPKTTAEPTDKKLERIQISTEITYKDFATQHNTTVEELNTLNALTLDQNTLLAP